ncbi:hypothetical protein RJT34_11283 [Clitoria ternatea]|uniref:Uncharacterized protein n=1 Tax=Clitoria ternatea TaxID=43366 RepID=A0AAN9PJX9_CLITE
MQKQGTENCCSLSSVHSVSLEGESRDTVVVTGDGIDSVFLTNKLRKKFNYATLVSVVDANASNDEGEQEQSQQSVETTSVETIGVENFPISYLNYPPPPFPIYHHLVYDDPCPNSCSIQ